MDLGYREDVSGYHVVDVAGKVDRLKDSIVLKSYISTLVEEKGITHVAMNLNQVSYMDSGALNVLIFSHHLLERLGGKLVLFSPNEYVMDVLTIVGFDQFITIYHSEKEFLKNAEKN